MEKFVWVGFSIFVLVIVGVSGAQIPAMFVFGDSVVDAGNNNNLPTLSKANFPHHGIDFSLGPTGRFCNGATLADHLGFLLEFGLIPPVKDPSTTGSELLQGVNFASSSAGILNGTGSNTGQVISMVEQVDIFGNQIVSELSSQVLSFNGVVLSIADYLAKSMFFSNMGNNDLLNNYLLPTANPFRRPVPPAFENLVVDRYAIHLKKLYQYGARKFLVSSLVPLGCIPIVIASYSEDVEQCYEPHNEVVSHVNVKIQMMIQRLNRELPSAHFLYWDLYSLVKQYIDNPSQNGFRNVHAACCGAGRANAQSSCSPVAFLCPNRSEFLFWDAFHLTDSATQLAARVAYEGALQSTFPMNVKQLLNV